MFSPLSSLIRNGRAALLLVAVACLTPDRAFAECGDHVTILPAATIQGGQTVTPDTPAPAVPAPCHGPNCSRRPDRPLPPSAVAPPTMSATEAALPSAAGPPLTARGAFARDNSSPEPIRRPLPVFHPPRHV